MKFHKNKLLTTVSAVALTFAVGACSSSSNDDDMMSGGPPPVIDPGAPDTGTSAPDPVLTELQKAQKEAMDAETAAMTASGEAETAAMAAMAAVANLATMQTDATAGGLAYEAHTAAGKAMMAYMVAKEASEAAAEAEVVTAAVEARIMAEEAMADAEMYAKMAADKGMAAETAAMAELMIVGKTKSVGDDTSITVGAPLASVTTTVADKSTTVVTGEIGKVTAMSAFVDVVTAEDATPPTEAVMAKPSIAARNINIGVRLDDDDDSARLTLVTHFIGTASVGGVYSGDGTAVVGGILQTAHNAYDHDDDSADADASPTVMIKMARGMFHETNEVDTGTVAKDAESTALYYYDAPAASPDDPLVRTWLRRTNTQTATDGTVTQNYNLYVADNVNAALANFPMMTAYKHLHYGTWNSLDDKGNAIDDLGIGFVTATSDGMGMTDDDMPNVGSADYNGHWVASVREADMEGDGKISEQTGESKMTAKFETNGIMVDLMGLAKLDGTITGDRFKGTKVTGVMAGDGGLDASGTFTGSFSGAFFGPKAAEAGGVFDYTSKDMKAGEFSGAFGGDKD